MNYEQARTAEILAAHDRRIEDFVRRYNPSKRTVLLVPGGMGSQLDRSAAPYKNASSLPFAFYDPVWIDLGIIFFGDALTLQIGDDLHDAGDHIVIPNGPLRFTLVGELDPYNLTRRYFERAGFNFITFGYDWRRTVGESAGFLEEFLRRFARRCKQVRGKDPRPETTLLCHSMGGLVAKVFLHRVAGTESRARKVGEWVERVVTVGTPFYGTATHVWRYYVGQPPLDSIYGRKKVAKFAGTMPGPYILMMLDEETFNRDGGALGLSEFPVIDADTRANADPYDAANIARFPPWVSRQYLAEAKRLFATISATLPAAAIERVYHVRSGRAEMATRFAWKQVDGARFNPEKHAAPFTRVLGADPVANRGDGTVPFWSARLPQTAADHVHDCEYAWDHGTLLEHKEVLTHVHGLLDSGTFRAAATPAMEVPPIERASLPEVEMFVNEVRAGAIQPDDPRASDPRIWRRIIEEVTP
jgi:pimeloyl-ACP methyl ester carboxylesterase